MTTKVFYNGIQTDVFISHEIIRKDFVIWCGFTLIDVLKSLDECKRLIETTLSKDGDTGVITYLTK